MYSYTTTELYLQIREELDNLQLYIHKKYIIQYIYIYVVVEYLSQVLSQQSAWWQEPGPISSLFRFLPPCQIHSSFS